MKIMRKNRLMIEENKIGPSAEAVLRYLRLANDFFAHRFSAIASSRLALSATICWRSVLLSVEVSVSSESRCRFLWVSFLQGKNGGDGQINWNQC